MWRSLLSSDNVFKNYSIESVWNMNNGETSVYSYTGKGSRFSLIVPNNNTIIRYIDWFLNLLFSSFLSTHDSVKYNLGCKSDVTKDEYLHIYWILCALRRYILRCTPRIIVQILTAIHRAVFRGGQWGNLPRATKYWSI